MKFFMSIYFKLLYVDNHSKDLLAEINCLVWRPYPCDREQASFRICTVLSILMLLGRNRGLLSIGAARLSLVFCKDIVDTCSICIARSFEC